MTICCKSQSSDDALRQQWELRKGGEQSRSQEGSPESEDPSGGCGGSGSRPASATRSSGVSPEPLAPWNIPTWPTHSPQKIQPFPANQYATIQPWTSCPDRDFHAPAHSSCIYNSQEPETSSNVHGQVNGQTNRDQQTYRQQTPSQP